MRIKTESALIAHRGGICHPPAFHFACDAIDVRMKAPVVSVYTGGREWLRGHMLGRRSRCEHTMALGTSAEHDAFERLMRPHLERLYRLAYRLTGTVSDAEDLVQDVLVKLYRRRKELSSIEDLAPWLSRVLYNQFVDAKRRYARQRLHVVSMHEPGAKSRVDNLAAPTSGPRQRTEVELDLRQLHIALEQLSDDHRMVVLLHDAEGYTLDEIHRITGVALGTLKSRLHRARERLRDIMETEPFAGQMRVSN